MIPAWRAPVFVGWTATGGENGTVRSGPTGSPVAASKTQTSPEPLTAPISEPSALNTRWTRLAGVIERRAERLACGDVDDVGVAIDEASDAEPGPVLVQLRSLPETGV